MKKYFLKFMISFALLLCCQNILASACNQYIGTCEYYQCQEQEYHCGEDGYLMHFGHRYCERFYQKLNERLSPKGQEWIDQVKVCLQEKMEQFTDDHSCKKLKKLAYRSHSDCYLKANFCQLSLSDKQKIIRFLGPELFKFRTQKEGFQVLYHCLKK